MRRPLSRLLGFSGLGGALGAFAVGGPIGLVGGVLVGALTEEVYTRVTEKELAALGAHGDFGAEGFGVKAFAAASGGATGLRPGEHVVAGQQLASPSGRFVLSLQRDGNLVLYSHDLQTHLWESGTADEGATSLIMQPNGNLELRAPDGTTVWSSGTNGQAGSRFTIHDDGNLAVYASNGLPVWQSHTAQTA